MHARGEQVRACSTAVEKERCERVFLSRSRSLNDGPAN